MSISYPSKLHRVIANAETYHFWFRARRKLIVSLIHRYIPQASHTRFCEVGYGTGELLSEIEQLGFQTTGVDINAEALAYARGKIRGTLIRTSLSTFDPSKKFDAIGLFDVLEHQKDDLAFLKHCARILKKNGLLFLTVPAGKWLWSDVDLLSAHVRRYTLQEVETRLHRAGFEVSYENYWNVFLLPFIYGRTFMSSSTLTPYLATPPRYINLILYGILRLEHMLFRWIRLPIGASIVVAARKKI